jgi:hypothetical protein
MSNGFPLLAATDGATKVTLKDLTPAPNFRFPFLNTHSFILGINLKGEKANGIRGHESGVILNDRPKLNPTFSGPENTSRV